jgi:PAS domain S-box-containing protein
MTPEPEVEETPKKRYNITSRKRPKETIIFEREMLEAVERCLGAGLAVISTDFRVIWANKHMREVFGDAENERCYRAYHGRSEVCENCGVREIFETGKEQVTRERSRRDVNGNVTWVQTIVTPIKDKHGKVTAALELVVPITERKRMEEELKRYSEHLKELVDARSQELVASEQKYHRLMDNTADAIFTVDLDGRLVYVNPAAERITQYTAAQLLNMNIKQLIAPEHYSTILERRKARIRGEKNLPPVEYNLVKADGSRVTVEMNASPVYNESGQLVGVQSTARDITERKKMEERLRESEEKFRTITEGSFDPIITLDSEGRITYASPAFFLMTGFSSAQIIGKHYTNYLPKDEIGKLTPTVTRILAGEAVRGIETEILKDDGSLCPVELSISPIIGIGGLVSAVEIIVRDVTERRRLMDMRDRFVSSVTHELRTPLVSIKGYLDFTLSEHKELSKEVELNLQVVERNSNRLLNLTNDLLDVQRMQAGRLQLNLKMLDFRQIVNQCAAEVQPFMHDRRQSLTLNVPEGPLPIHGDPIRLEQVLVNLLSNASKFTSEGGNITIHVIEQADVIKVQVSDTGIGIRPEDLERIFQPFASIQKDNYIKGTGLGLSITKGLVEAHGGKISAESAGEGKGATLTFTIPKRRT